MCIREKPVSTNKPALPSKKVPIRESNQTGTGESFLNQGGDSPVTQNEPHKKSDKQFFSSVIIFLF